MEVLIKSEWGHGMEEVVGSIPTRPTKGEKPKWLRELEACGGTAVEVANDGGI